MPRVIVKLKPTGNQVAVDVDGEGFRGKQCDGVLDKFVVAATGDANALARTSVKPEYAMETSQEAEFTS